jgi:hypothetical protein
MRARTAEGTSHAEPASTGREDRSCIARTSIKLEGRHKQDL